jgi:hypothetical protein
MPSTPARTGIAELLADPFALPAPRRPRHAKPKVSLFRRIRSALAVQRNEG